MRKLFLALVIAAATPVAAEEEKTHCEQVSRLATFVMESRQEGMSLSDVLSLAKGMVIEKTVKIMAMQAYDVPRFNMPENQKIRVTEFANEWHLSCLRVEAQNNG